LVGVFGGYSEKFIRFELGEWFRSFGIDDPAFGEAFGDMGEGIIFQDLVELSKPFRIFGDAYV
jgi:hypothetical protein